MTLSEVQAITTTARQRLFEQTTKNVSDLIMQVAEKGGTCLGIKFGGASIPDEKLCLLENPHPNDYNTTLHYTICPNAFREFFENKGFTVKVGSYGNTREIIKSYYISWR